MADMKPQVYKDPRPAEYFTQFHDSARTRLDLDLHDGPRRPHPADAPALPDRGRSAARTCPREGALVLAPNHFSQMDHFFAGVYLRRKIRFMAKSQLFGPPVLTYIFKHGGVFPVRRGHHDEEAFKTAYELLDQGEMLLVYAEGGRSRTGELGEPKPGIGRIALESGAPIVPVAIHGSAGVRGWKRLRFPKVTSSSASRSASRSRPNPSRERQLEVAAEIFARVKEMYEALATRSAARSGSRTPDRARA